MPLSAASILLHDGGRDRADGHGGADQREKQDVALHDGLEGDAAVGFLNAEAVGAGLGDGIAFACEQRKNLPKSRVGRLRHIVPIEDTFEARGLFRGHL